MVNNRQLTLTGTDRVDFWSDPENILDAAKKAGEKKAGTNGTNGLRL